MQPSLAGDKAIHFVDNPTALASCLRELSAHGVIAFDLEFDSHRHSYGVTLCLVQVATPAGCFIIDPFAAIDLSGLYALFEDERIQKLVHSPGEDLRLLHALQCYPKNVFDTEVVAKLLNYEQTSLAIMLQKKLDYAMNKQQQRSNWLRRPLTPEQLEYAAADVALLHALKAVLEQEAAEKGLMPFVLEEQSALSTTIYRPEAKTDFLKQADRYALSPYDQYVLNALFAYRDELAQQLNKPAYQLMDESLLRALAAGTMSPGNLSTAKGLYGGFKNERFADKLSTRLAAISEAAAGLDRAIPARQRSSPEGRTVRVQADHDREHKFAPIQEVLVQRYGIYAARFMLSNGMVNDLLKHNLRINEIKYAYRRKLISTITDDLGIDLSGYE